jgi:hypothetical protein
MHDQNEADVFLLKHNMGSRRPENPDLKAERNKCTFNPLELTFLLDGGRTNTKERKLIGKTSKIHRCWSLRACG